MSGTGAILEVYHGAEIAFGGDGWVNATQMAKAFQKAPASFTRTDGAKAFIAALEKDTVQKCIVNREGRGGGTWMHPDLALEFARWLAPEFAIWCNRVVRRVMAGGGTAESAVLVAIQEGLRQNAATLQQVGAALATITARIEKLENPAVEVLPAARSESKTVDIIEAGEIAALGAALLATAVDNAYWLGPIEEIEKARGALNLLARVTHASNLHQRHSHLGWLICRYLGEPLESTAGRICWRARGHNQHRLYYVVRMDRKAVAA